MRARMLSDIALLTHGLSPAEMFRYVSCVTQGKPDFFRVIARGKRLAGGAIGKLREHEVIGQRGTALPQYFRDESPKFAVSHQF